MGDAKPTVPSAQVSTGKGDEAVTSSAAAPVQQQKVLGKEERVEYRDQDGNLLDQEQVASLMAEGKASFSTKYETETKLVDEFGNLVQDPKSVAPEHPDVDGQNPDTKGSSDASRKPAKADIPSEPAEDKQVKSPEAQPASEASEATQ